MHNSTVRLQYLKFSMAAKQDPVKRLKIIHSAADTASRARGPLFEHRGSVYADGGSTR